MKPGWSLFLICALVCFSFGTFAAAQEDQDNQPHIQPRIDPNSPAKKKAEEKPQEGNPRKAEQGGDSSSVRSGNPQAADNEQGESSSTDSQIDLSVHPPEPASGTRAAEDANAYPFDPHRAEKDIEVGNYYLKLKNYRAALDRFHDALLYKPDDAEATYELAVTQDKMELVDQAYRMYAKYLEILPHGPMAGNAEAAMNRLAPRLEKVASSSPDTKRQAVRALEQGESFLAQNDYDAAHLRFEQAMRLTPEDPVVYFRLAQSLQGMQRLDPARLYYKRYLEMQPAGPFAEDAKRSIQQISDVLGK